MATPDPDPVPVPEAPVTKTKTTKQATDAPETIALDDWCQAHSLTLGRRVEALAAFHRDCQRRGLGRASADQFLAQFNAFLAQPA